MVKKICELIPEQFDILTKILMLLKKHRAIIIKDAKICQTFKTATLLANFTEVLENPNFSLTIQDPENKLDDFKFFAKSKEIINIYEEENKFIITSGLVEMFIPKIEEKYEQADIPDMNSYNTITEFTITKELYQTIKSFIKNSERDYIYILLKEDNVIGITIPERANIRFAGFEKLNFEDNEILKLKSFSFLSIDGDEYKVSLLKNKKKNEFSILTNINSGIEKLKLFLYETLDIYDDTESIF